MGILGAIDQGEGAHFLGGDGVLEARVARLHDTAIDVAAKIDERAGEQKLELGELARRFQLHHPFDLGDAVIGRVEAQLAGVLEDLQDIASLGFGPVIAHP